MKNNHEEVTALIGGLAYGGSFIGQIENGQQNYLGKKIFIREVITGEKVTALITKDHKRYVEGSLLKVINSSENRTEPPCPVFGLCGGCDLQHITITAQRQEKLAMVRDTLRLKGKVEPESGFHLLGEDLPAFNYRNRVSLHVDKDGKIGFFKSGTYQVVDFESCQIASLSINNAFSIIRPYISSFKPALTKVIIEERDDDIALIFHLDSNSPDNFNIEKLISPIQKHFSMIQLIHRDATLVNTLPKHLSDVGRFSQINFAANQILANCVLENCNIPNVTELYAGAGNFTFNLYNKVNKIDAVELDPLLVKKGKEQVKQLALDGKVNFYLMSVEQFIKDHELQECVILDPPRSGIKSIVKSLIVSNAKKLIYISCNLPSLTRDLKELCEGGFIYEKTYIIDMFPQTHHVETLSIISR